jgi:hypothetical protein
MPMWMKSLQPGNCLIYSIWPTVLPVVASPRKTDFGTPPILLGEYAWSYSRNPCKVLVHILLELKGTVSRDFLLLVFYESVSPPPAPKYPIRIFQKFMEIFASQGAPPASTTPWQICHCYQQHQRQILPPVSLVLLIPVANLQYQAAEILKWTWRQKCIYKLSLPPKGVQTK